MTDVQVTELGVAGSVFLNPVESYNGAVNQWFEITLGKLVLGKVRCWSDEGEPEVWNLYWAGRECLQVEDAPTFEHPVIAASWFYDNHIKRHT
jgi:hypothetical protein